MTQDYKDNIMKYLTGDINIETENPTPQYSNMQEQEKENIIDILDARYPDGYSQLGELNCKNSRGENNGFTIVYGNYYKDSSSTSMTNQRGYMIVYDDNIDEVAIIDTFSSGTYLSPFILLKVDETGQVYGLDVSEKETSNYRVRFIMLNNISVKLPEQNYQVVLRQSYYIPDEYTGFSQLPIYNDIYKDPNSARYLFARNGFESLELYIQVGASNEWTLYEIPDGSNLSIKRIKNASAIWDSDGNLTYVYYGLAESQSDEITKITKFYNDGTDINYTFLDSVDDLFSDLTDFTLNSSSTMVRQYKSYYEYTINDTSALLMMGGTYDDNGDARAIYRVFKVDNGTTTKIYESTSDTIAGTSALMFCKLYIINGNTLFNYYWCLNPNSQHTLYQFYTGISFTYNNQIITNDANMGGTSGSQLDKFHIFDIRNVYNLYTIYYLGEEFDTGDIILNKRNLIFNSENYNGTAYEDYTLLVPNQMILYDDDGVVFARNLYDKVVYNNITESTVQIPNTMLNDATITQENLMGETGYTLSSNEDTIEKNIYETLYINVFNKINITDKNDPDNPIPNTEAAATLNSHASVNHGSDEQNMIYCQRTSLRWVRMNYKDGTRASRYSYFNLIPDTNTYRMEQYITPTKELESIQILSNDLNTIYLTITDVDNYEINHTYLISQDCYIEEE